MIPTWGWISIIFALVIVSVLLDAIEDTKTYKNNKCYDRSTYKCLKCRKYGCKYHVIAERNYKSEY